MAPAPFEVVQSDIADSADEITVDPFSNESDDTCFPPILCQETPQAKENQEVIKLALRSAWWQ